MIPKYLIGENIRLPKNVASFALLFRTRRPGPKRMMEALWPCECHLGEGGVVVQSLYLFCRPFRAVCVLK